MSHVEAPVSGTPANLQICDLNKALLLSVAVNLVVVSYGALLWLCQLADLSFYSKRPCL